MAKDEPTQQSINFNLDPNRAPVLLVDGYMIGSNENFVTLNFSQAMIDGSQQNIVVRLAMLPAQAKEFVAKLNDHIEKFEV
jgi:hypothetical protein